MSRQSTSRGNNIVLSFNHTLLREDDVNLLTGPHWLNDQIISFNLEYLETVVYKNENNILFISPEVVQCLKLTPDAESIFLDPLNAKEKSFIFLPLNDNVEDQVGGNHWTLLAFSRPESTFFYYDSMQNSQSLKSITPFVRKIASAIDCSEFDLVKGHCIRQWNSYDCGIHVLCMIDELAKRAAQHDCLDDRDDDDSDRRERDRRLNDCIRNKRNDLIKLIEKLSKK